MGGLSIEYGVRVFDIFFSMGIHRVTGAAPERGVMGCMR